LLFLAPAKAGCKESLLSIATIVLYSYKALTTKQQKFYAMSQVYTHKTDAMRQLLNLVSRGYSRYTRGTVAPKKLEALTLKFEDRYRIEKTSQQRFRSRIKDEANCFLIAWLESPEVVHWWLVVTAGTGLIEDLETLQDAAHKKTRIELTGYELVKTPREGTRAQWSWRMTTECYGAWETRLKTAVRQYSDDALRQALFSLKRVPAFAESRKQAFALAKLAQAEWARSKSTAWPYGAIYLGWFGQFKKAEKVEARTISTNATKKRKKITAAEEPQKITSLEEKQ
jgi:hypothetical protein